MGEGNAARENLIDTHDRGARTETPANQALRNRNLTYPNYQELFIMSSRDWQKGDKVMNVGDNFGSDRMGMIGEVSEATTYTGDYCPYGSRVQAEVAIEGGTLIGNQENLEGWGWRKVEPVSDHI